jgi:hypothetical protein
MAAREQTPARDDDLIAVCREAVGRAVTEEREACARIVEQAGGYDLTRLAPKSKAGGACLQPHYCEAITGIAAAIRARG